MQNVIEYYLLSDGSPWARQYVVDAQGIALSGQAILNVPGGAGAVAEGVYKAALAVRLSQGRFAVVASPTPDDLAANLIASSTTTP